MPIYLHSSLVILLGLFIGTISGSLGVGSAIILIPALTVFMHFPQKTAQGISLLVMVPMTLTAAIRYYQSTGTSHTWPVIILLMIGAVAGALIGSSIAFAISADILRKFFAVFIVIVGIYMFFK